MPGLPLVLIAGAAAGLVASFAMNLYQGVAAPAFGADKGSDDPATVKAADSAKRLAGGGPVTQKRRALAGSVVHYGFGVALGVAYAALVAFDPSVAFGFGVGYAIVVALVFDDTLVPAFGWGAWPWKSGLASQAYSLSSHVVFGVVLEGVRRLGVRLLD